MYLANTAKTCSILQLVNVYRYDIDSLSFEAVLERLIKDFDSSPYTYSGNLDNKVIQYNTKFSWRRDFFIRRKLYKLGFRQVSSYIGRSGHKVFILILKGKTTFKAKDIYKD